MTLPDEFADVLAGTVEVADPAAVAAEPVVPAATEPAAVPTAAVPAAAVPAAPVAAALADAHEQEAADEAVVEELELATGLDGHLDLRLLSDVQVELAVELGRITVPLRALLGLAAGSVLQLDRRADAPVDVLVGGSPVGRGEVVVLGGDFGVRVTSLVDR